MTLLGKALMVGAETDLGRETRVLSIYYNADAKLTLTSPELASYRPKVRWSCDNLRRLYRFCGFVQRWVPMTPIEVVRNSCVIGWQDA